MPIDTRAQLAYLMDFGHGIHDKERSFFLRESKIVTDVFP